MIEVFDALSLQNNQHQIALDEAALPAQILITNNIQDLADIWPRSTQLGTARCHVFQCADILELYCETVAPARSAKPYFVAILNKQSEPLALIPLSIERVNTTRILRFADGGLSELNAPILYLPVQKWDQQTIEFIWRNLRKILPFDVAILEKMPDRVGELPNPLYGVRTREDDASSYAMTLSKSWAEFSTKLPRRRTMLRLARRLSECGTVALEVAETPEKYDIILEVLMHQKTQRYLETRGFDGLARPGYRPFLKIARRLVSPSGPVCLFALKVDDVIVATLWGYILGSRFYYFMPSFEGGKWRPFSPGRVLVDKVIEWCVAKQLDLFDYGFGDEEYKREFCDRTTVLYRAEIPSTIRGRIYLLRGKVKIYLSRSRIIWHLNALRRRVVQKGKSLLRLQSDVNN